MRSTLPTAAALVVIAASALSQPHLRAAASQAAQAVQAPAMTRVSGRVVAGDPPAAVPGTLVTAAANGKLVASAMTDADGVFTIDVPPAVASIMVSKRGFVTVTRPVAGKGVPLRPVDITLTRAAIVSGRVLDAQGRPIVSVRVNLTPLETTAGSQTVTTITDDRGMFRIGGLRPATYSIVTDGRPEYQSTIINSTLSPESAAIMRQFKMAVAPSSEAVTLQTRAGSETSVTLAYRDTTVILSYAEVGGVIAGRVVDESGEAAPGLTVRVVRVGGAGTPGSEISNVPRLTDDRGEYRLFHIPAGQYFLMVTDESQNGTGSQPSWLPVYFPGTLAATDAIPLTLGRSEEATGINVIFSRSRGTRVSGYLLNEAGQPVRTQVRLTAATPFNGMPLPARVTVSGEDGRFEFASVLPGQYTLRAATSAVTAAAGQTLFVMVSGAAPTPATSAPPTEYGVLTIDAQGEEVGPMVVQMRPGASISGRLVLETSGPRGEPPAFTFAAIAAGESYGMSDPPMLQASIDPDFQSFRISGVSGTMRLRLASGQQNWWLRSATINGVDATESPITLMSSRDSTSDAVFVLADTAGSISGRATSGQAPLEDGWAIVFPVDRDQRFNGSQRVMAVNLYIGGRFTASNVPPGDYYVAAVEGLAPLPQNELRFRDLLEELTPRARRVTVGPRQTVTLTQSVPGTAR